MEKFNPQNILVRIPNWLGDAVMASAAMEDLSRFYETKLSIVCEKKLVDLFHGHPRIHKIFPFDKNHRKDQIHKRLKEENFDLGILFTNSFSSAWQLFQAKVKTRWGFKNEMRSLLLSKALPVPKEKGKEHLVITYKRLLQPLGIPLSTTAPTLYLTEEDRKAAEKILKNHSIPSKAFLIGINPGAAYGQAKCWLPERFKELSDKLLENENACVLYFGDSSSKPLIDSLCPNSPRIVNLAGKTSLRELMSLIKKCAIFLTNDSGPMHVAAALKTPLVALFGSTNEIATGPYNHGLVIHKHVKCSPCYQRVCPIDFKCMKQIQVEEVLKALGSVSNLIDNK